MNPKKILRILIISGMMVALGSLILPSRFWQSILQAESIPPCDGAQLRALIKEARGSGNEGLAKEMEEYLDKYPNLTPNSPRRSLEDGSSWSSPGPNVGSRVATVITIPKNSWARFLSSCPQPAPNMSRPPRDHVTPDTPNLTDIAKIRQQPANNENSTVSTTTVLRPGGWY